MRVWIQKSFALFCNETVASCECQEHRIREHVASLIDTDDDEEEEPTDSVICPAYLVGYVVGRNGQTMKYLREQTNTRIYIEDAHVEGMRRVVVQGAHSVQTERAKQMIYSILGIGCSEMSCSGKGICQVLTPLCMAHGVLGVFAVWHDAGAEMPTKRHRTRHRASGTDAQNDPIDPLREAFDPSRIRTVYRQYLWYELRCRPCSVGDSRDRRRLESNRRVDNLLWCVVVFRSIVRSIATATHVCSCDEIVKWMAETG